MENTGLRSGHEGGACHGDITACLQQWNAGDRTAADEVFRILYDDLRRVAAACSRRERRGHTLQPSAIVHEAYLRMSSQKPIRWEHRAHFLAFAARLMRQALTDYARSRNRAKRWPDRLRVSLADDVSVLGYSMEDVLAVNECLDKLARIDERKAQVLEAHFFGGMTVNETAAYLGISRTTVVRDLELAKAWLRGQLERETRAD